MKNMNGVLLSMPSVLAPQALPADGTAARSWIQLAKTGSFVSNRYGKFAITREDLAQMLHNFQHVTPKAPTELPVDFDHKALDVKHFGDGIAAGWMKKLELREGGEQLWAEVEWTPRAAHLIKNQEYRFISPSFVKDHVDTHSGKKIGTTLLAAAVTNFPFLQGMDSIALCGADITGQFASGVSDQENAMELVKKGTSPPTKPPFFLAAMGQRVTFTDDLAKVPELTPTERAAVYTVQSISDDGEFVRLVDADGKDFGWFKASDQLAPAPAPDKAATPPEAMTKVTPQTAEEQVAQSAPPFAMSGDEVTSHLVALSNTRAQQKRIPFSEAVKEISRDFPHLVLLRDGHDLAPARTSTISLHAPQTPSFYDRVMTLKIERKIGDLEAVHLAQQLYPDAAQRYADGDF